MAGQLLAFAGIQGLIVGCAQWITLRTSKSRIKRLRGLLRPQYRMRVGDVRVFYDVGEGSVEILGIVNKDDADAWLEETGEPDEDGSPERS